MDAAADYAAARAMLARPLPAYVSYVARSHVKFDAIVRDGTQEVVVRTSDGAVIKGRDAIHPPFVQVSGEKLGGDEAVTNPAFIPHCYVATGARMDSYDGSKAEAIALRDDCAKSPDDKDFDTLYVDPQTHRPIAATGTEIDSPVSVRLEQGFAAAGGYVLPASLYVRVKGTGIMAWLDVLYDRRYENFRFSATEPS